MSRRLYRSMAQARASLNSMNRGTPAISAEAMAAIERESAKRDAELDAIVARRRALTAEALTKVEHPVIDLSGKPFRVVRLFRADGHLCYESIGEALTVEVATMILKRERWRAQVLSETERVCADNWHEMERR